MSDCRPMPLDAGFLRRSCSGRAIGHKIYVFDQVSSTNEVALRWGESGEPDGCVIIAESQISGRGRFGRRWHSAPRCGIWCSLLLRPSFPPAQAACLTPFATVAVASSISRFLGLEVTLKLPNDLYLSRGKVCGLLIEARTGERFFAVVGIGINVNQLRNDFPAALRGIATSLREETGALYDRTQIALVVLTELDYLYTRLAEQLPAVQSLYEAWPRWRTASSSRKIG
ncbi:MAG: biotin--[acetyl-CoA-carboxylase] ligase [Candidatus Xiphinematobacter sp.]|nr:MAG: biotin--[acetyl-CoA-carboxylase] ligase [Candidatus Xiphinematobacter sp.]